MPIVNQTVIWYSAQKWGNDAYTASWEMNIPPTPTMVKAFVSSFINTADTIALAEITSFRRRLPNGADQTIVLPFGETTHGLWENSLSSVTFGLIVRNCIADLTGVLDFWR